MIKNGVITHKKSNLGHGFLTVLLLCGVTGCSLLPSTPSLQNYALPQPSTITKQHGAKVRWSLRIGQPTTNQFLNSARIAVQPQGTKMAVYKGVRWTDPAPELLKNRILQAFLDDGRIQALGSDNSVQTDLELDGDLIDYQTVYIDGQPTVVVRFYAKLVNTKDRKMIASKTFIARQPIYTREIEEAIKAFGLATDHFTSQLVAWTIQQGNHSKTTP